MKFPQESRSPVPGPRSPALAFEIGQRCEDDSGKPAPGPLKTWLRRFKRWYRRPFRRRRYARVALRTGIDERITGAFVSIVLPTYNRLSFIKCGIPSLLAATRDVRCELVVWDNGSTDGSGEWLATLEDERLRVHHHPENIGLNALAAAVRLTRGDHILQVDDDVLWFPRAFLSALLRAYHSIPDMGYLGTNVIADAFTDGGRLPPRRSVRVAHSAELCIDYGAVGGWCTLTERRLYDAVGGFLERPGERYFWVDRDYYRKLGQRGLKRGILVPVEVYHAFRVALDGAAQAAFGARRDERAELPELAEGFWESIERRFGEAQGTS